MVVVACCWCWCWCCLCFEDCKKRGAVDVVDDDGRSEADFERVWEEWSRLGWRFVDEVAVRLLERLDARECVRSDAGGGGGVAAGGCLAVVDERVLFLFVSLFAVPVGGVVEVFEVFEAVVDVCVGVVMVVICVGKEEVEEEEAVSVWLFGLFVRVLVFWLAVVSLLLVGDKTVLAVIRVLLRPIVAVVLAVGIILVVVALVAVELLAVLTALLLLCFFLAGSLGRLALLVDDEQEEEQVEQEGCGAGGCG